MSILARAIVVSLIRRLLGYSGVAAVVGLDSEIFQAAGGLVAALTVAWSVYEKVREARKHGG